MMDLPRRRLFGGGALLALTPPLLNPDRELMEVCAALGRQRDEWQRLWTRTSDRPDLVTAADQEWARYDRNVWPGRSGGLVVRLLDLPARTSEGLAAKAAAVCAMDDAAGYTGAGHDDDCALWASVARDAAGRAYRPLGEAAT